jgi:hypothetical protein
MREEIGRIRHGSPPQRREIVGSNPTPGAFHRTPEGFACRGDRVVRIMDEEARLPRIDDPLLYSSAEISSQKSELA